MAQSPEDARRVLEKMCAGLQDKAMQETRMLAGLKLSLEGASGPEQRVRIEAWDKQFYAGEARRSAARADSTVNRYSMITIIILMNVIITGITPAPPAQPGRILR